MPLSVINGLIPDAIKRPVSYRRGAEEYVRRGWARIKQSSLDCSASNLDFPDTLDFNVDTNSLKPLTLTIQRVEYRASGGLHARFPGCAVFVQDTPFTGDTFSYLGPF